MTNDVTIIEDEPKTRIKPGQRALFIEAIERGATAREAARLARIHRFQLPQLLDLLNGNTAQLAIGASVHADIVSTGKQLAWRVARELMESPATPAPTRWAAARWTLEASGEGIGVTRAARQKPKDLHEMSEAELTRFIEAARQVVAHTAIDITPATLPDTVDDTDYDGLFT